MKRAGDSGAFLVSACMLKLFAMNLHLRKIIHQVRLSTALATCVGVLLAYLVGMYVTGTFHEASRWLGALLACTSTIVVLRIHGFRKSLRTGWLRVLGTALGALIAYFYLAFFHFTLEGLLISVFVLEIVGMLLKISEDGQIGTITLVTIMLISQMSPDLSPGVNSLLRFVESAVGVGIGIGMVWTLEHYQRWRQKRKKADSE